MVVVDIRRDVDFVDAIFSALGLVSDLVRRLSRIDRTVISKEARLAREEHAKTDHFLSIRELIKAFDKELPVLDRTQKVYREASGSLDDLG